MKYYLIGIKGSGMSSLASILLDLGHEVRGADISGFFYTCDRIKELQIDSLDNILLDKDYTYIIGNAFKKSNIVKKLKNYKVEYYANFIDKLYNNINIAISGTHGKTTTTKILASMIEDASYLIGDSEGCGRNTKYFIYEACEYRNTFLDYHPDILYVGNIDYDHPDFYKSIDETFNSFNTLSKKANVLITNGDYYYSRKLECDNKITFGFREENDCVIKSVKVNKGNLLKIRYFDENTEMIIPYYGEHMIYNFIGAYTILRYLGFSNDYVKAHIKDIRLPLRRSEEYYDGNNFYICDYAHHPTEILAFYEGIKENPKYNGYKKIIIFEPHTISRLKEFKEEYKEVLKLFDDAYLYPLFTSIREKNNENMISNLYKFLEFKEFYELPKYKKAVICFVGAGVIDKEFNKVKKQKNRDNEKL